MFNLKLRNNGLILLGLFAFYFLAWAIANWPALHQAWWYRDDFYLIEYRADSILSGLYSGRPVEGVLYFTFYLDASGQAELQNIFMRFIQGAFHCLAASLGAYFVWKDTHHPSAFVGLLPFVLWPFNAEAVLWRSAIGYPVAALLSVLGLALVMQQGRGRSVYRLLGAVCMVLAVLSKQVTALAGPVIWFLIVCLRWVHERPPLGFLGAKQLTYLLSGGIGGGLISVAIVRHYDTDLERSGFAVDLWDRLKYITDLNVLFISWPGFYPTWLVLAHVALLVVAFCLLLVAALKRNQTFGTLVTFMFVCFVGFVFPFAPHLVLAETWPSFRVLYLAPLMVSIAWLTTIQLRTNVVFRYIAAGIFCVILLGYVQIAWKNAEEYPLVFKADLQKLQALTEAANRQQATDIFVVTFPEYEVIEWNPYQVKYMHADSKISAFLTDYSADSFIRLFSPLKPTRSAEGQAVCHRVCSASPYELNSKIDIVEAGSILCVCP
jgi:hypothetical protein